MKPNGFYRPLIPDQFLTHFGQLQNRRQYMRHKVLSIKGKMIRLNGIAVLVVPFFSKFFEDV